MTTLVSGTREAGLAYDIHKSAHIKPWSASAFEDCFTKPYEAFVQWHDETVAGYAILLIVVDEMTLMDIAVDECSRGKGIGRALLKTAIERAQVLSIAKIWLEVRASNHIAFSLYARLGFEVVEVRKGYYDSTDGKEDANIMCLDLSLQN